MSKEVATSRPRVRRSLMPVADLLPAAGDGKQQEKEQQRPDDPVGDDVERRDAGELLEVDRQHAPNAVGEQAEDEAGPGRVCGARRVGSAVHRPRA